MFWFFLKATIRLLYARKMVKIRQWMEYPRAKLWNSDSRGKRFENFDKKKGKEENFDSLSNE